MKKKAFVTILSATLLFTGCSSGKAPATSATEATTTAVTTKATTEATTTIAETTAEQDKPEDYADIVYFNEDKSDTPNASDFEFVDAGLFKDANGVLKYPNYVEGKDIVIKFKSDKELKYGGIARYSSLKNYNSETIAYAVSSMNDSQNKLLKMLTIEDGVYTLKIPGKYAQADSDFCVELYTKLPNRDRDNNIIGHGMIFYIRCEKVTETPIPEFSPETHARMNNQVGAKDFDFGDPELVVTNDKHKYHTELPKYKANTDITITFKCEKKLVLSNLMVIASKSVYEEITNRNFLKNVKGTYTLTIPAEYVKPGREFDISIKSEGKNSKTLLFMVAC